MFFYKIALFGHRDFSAHNVVERKLYPILCELVKTKPFIEVLLGRNGEFDIFAASLFKRVQNALGKENSAITLVLPYKHKDIQYFEEYYDSIVIPEFLANSHPKGAILKRNKFIVEQCDLLICFVERRTGGAYSAMKYAQSLGKKVINIAEISNNEL